MRFVYVLRDEYTSTKGSALAGASEDQAIEGMEVVGDQITVKFAVHRP